MPIYEYHCNACDHEFEVMQKMSDRPIRKCEKCGRLKAKKMISRTSFVLKGSGWYVTDYGGKKPSNGDQEHAESTESKKSDKSESSAETKSDSKSESSKKGGASDKAAAASAN
jgi:putative FmdB family regulatory protein